MSRNSIQLGCFAYLVINFMPILPSGSFFNDFSSTLFGLIFQLCMHVMKNKYFQSC